MSELENEKLDRDVIEYDHPLLTDKQLNPLKSKRLLALMVVLFIAQIILTLTAIFYQPKPLDVILNYTVTVEDVNDYGEMTNTYYIKWKVLDSDTEGALSWVRIGMPNPNYTILSGINDYTYSNDGNYVNIYFNRSFYENEIVEFSFTVKQKRMVYKDGEVVKFEFTPGWFDQIAVESYEFRWAKENVDVTNADLETDDYFVWHGALAKGEVRTMNVSYVQGALQDAEHVTYRTFGRQKEFDQRRFETVVFCIVLLVVITVIQVGLLDRAFVYRSGRGFIPHRYYIYINNRSSGKGGGGGGGCACGCACACACAGGGRAGCSVKDFSNVDKDDEHKDESLE